MKDLIKVGDEVRVTFNNSQYTLCRKGVIEYIPCATGDSWVIRDEYGNIHYISEGCTITKIQVL